MNRILFERTEITAEGRVTFGGVRADHVARVLHGAVGQTLKTGEINGKIGTGVIEEISGEPAPAGGDPESASLRITARVVHDETAMPPWCDLLLAPPRPRAFKRLLPQLTQMGVRRILLIGAAKVEKAFWGAQVLKPEIYRPLLIDGLMQAGTTALPEIVQIRNFRHYLEKDLERDYAGVPRILAHPGENHGKESLTMENSEILLAIGPEGGWTDEELSLLEQHRFLRYSLGPRILRTDTAAIALMARFMPGLMH